MKNAINQLIDTFVNDSRSFIIDSESTVAEYILRDTRESGIWDYYFEDDEIVDEEEVVSFLTNNYSYYLGVSESEENQIKNLNYCPIGKFNSYAEGCKYFERVGDILNREADLEYEIQDYADFYDQDYKCMYFGSDNYGLFVFRISKNLYAVYVASVEIDSEIEYLTYTELLQKIIEVKNDSI